MIKRTIPGLLPKPKPIYVPPVNPLAKTEWVPTFLKKNGTIVQGHWSKPKYRHNINPNR